MAVADRWHKSRPRPGEAACREHRMVPAAGHGQGDRWQVRWRDEDGKQRARTFARKTGADPEKCADAFDAKVRTSLDDGSYVSPADANTTFRDFAEDWRKARTHDLVTAGRIERELRLHAYPAIGHRTLRELEKRPSLTQAWISGMRLAPSSARQVIRDVSAVFLAAMDDGLIGRNPARAKSVTRPKVPERKAQPWTLGQVGAMAAALPARYAVLPYLGAGAGPRQGEMFGLAVDDIDFLRKVIHVRRQVRLIGDVPCFAPVKNDKAHDVPLAGSLAPVLAEHIRLYPPAAVTLPWLVPDGRPVTFTLLVTRPDGSAMNRTRFNESHWRPARVKAGIVAAPERGGKRAPAREHGMHALRHTAASAWLSAGVGIPAVAAWLGDTEQTVLSSYAHMMPADDDRGRKAMDAFFTPASPGSARNVHAEGRQ
jgi:integrase